VGTQCVWPGADMPDMPTAEEQGVCPSRRIKLKQAMLERCPVLELWAVGAPQLCCEAPGGEAVRARCAAGAAKRPGSVGAAAPPAARARRALTRGARARAQLLWRYSREAVQMRLRYLQTEQGAEAHTVLVQDIPGVSYGTPLHRLDATVLAVLPGAVKNPAKRYIGRAVSLGEKGMQATAGKLANTLITTRCGPPAARRWRGPSDRCLRARLCKPGRAGIQTPIITCANEEGTNAGPVHARVTCGLLTRSAYG